MELCGSRFCQSAGQQLGVLGDGVDVGRQRQGDDIGLQPVDHGAGLGARTAIGGVDRDRVAGLGLPLRGEGVAQILVQFARRIIADIEQRDVGRLGGGGGEQSRRDQKGKNAFHDCSPEFRGKAGRARRSADNSGRH